MASYEPPQKKSTFQPSKPPPESDLKPNGDFPPPQQQGEEQNFEETDIGKRNAAHRQRQQALLAQQWETYQRFQAVGNNLFDSQSTAEEGVENEQQSDSVETEATQKSNAPSIPETPDGNSNSSNTGENDLSIISSATPNWVQKHYNAVAVDQENQQAFSAQGWEAYNRFQAVDNNLYDPQTAPQEVQAKSVVEEVGKQQAEPKTLATTSEQKSNNLTQDNQGEKQLQSQGQREQPLQCNNLKSCIRMGNEAFENNRLPEAMNHYKAALNMAESSPAYAYLLSQISTIYFHLGNIAESSRYYDLSVQTYGSDAIALYSTALDLFRRGKYIEARETIEITLRNHWEQLDELTLKSFEELKERINTALDNIGPLTEIQVAEAIAYNESQKYEKAIIQEIQRVVRLRHEDGIFNSRTVQGIAYWQSHKGWTPVDGKVTQETLRLMGINTPRSQAEEEEEQTWQQRLWSILNTIGGGLLGEFNSDPSLGAIAIDTTIGLIPGFDQVADGRDLIAHLYFMLFKGEYNNTFRWIGLAFSLIGLIPTFGSA
ncbi:MAG: peptidoglycan-binding protein, partial [Spirulinaceae cyanobacterium]